MNGTFLISLDYELMWGMFDVVTKSGYGKTNIENVPIVIDRMLSLFQKYDVHATIAAVGMLMYKNKEDLLNDIPSLTPSYDNLNCSVYNGVIDDIMENEQLQFFQPEVVEKIRKVKTVEVGTHTYSHYYCWEKGQTIEQFEADIKKAYEVAARKDIELKSIIFPRNQVSPDYLKVCAKYGITAYRGNALKYFDEPKSIFDLVKNRMCRMIDAYFNIGGMTTVPYGDIDITECPVNLRASRLLRPFSQKLAFLEGLRLRRMKQEMLHAAKNGEMYHIWWHPHNFGANLEKNLAFLEELLKYYKACHEKYGMQSYTMNEMVKYLTDSIKDEHN